MIQEKRENNILLYLQLLAFGLMLVFSPCSMRNSIEDSLNLERTEVSNKSKTANNFGADCNSLLVENSGDHPKGVVHTTPTIPSFVLASVCRFHDGYWKSSEDLSISQYEAPYTVKDKTPLYLLHQQLKTHLPLV